MHAGATDKLLPCCDAAIDLHSGGKASVFVPCVLTDIDAASECGAANLALAKAFAAPYLWASGPSNDDRSLNAAATRQGIPMIAAELGGGGDCNPAMTDFTEAALRRCLSHLGLIDVRDAAEVPASKRITLSETLTSPAEGLFDRRFAAGDPVQAGQPAGTLHFPREPERASQPLAFPCDGIVLAHGNRGMVQRGDMLALIATPLDREKDTI